MDASVTTNPACRPDMTGRAGGAHDVPHHGIDQQQLGYPPPLPVPMCQNDPAAIIVPSVFSSGNNSPALLSTARTRHPSDQVEHEQHISQGEESSR